MTSVRVWRAGSAAAVLLLVSGQALASFPIGQTIAAGGRDQVFRMTDTGGGAGTANLFGVWSNATEVRLCFVTANHVAAAGVASIDYRGHGHAGTFNAVPVTQTVQQVPGEDMAFVGLKFSKAQIGAANFATFAGLTGLTLAADAGGLHTFQEWGYGISATPDTINGTAYPFVHHVALPAERYGTLRTFTNTYTGNAARTNGSGINIRDVKWVVGGAAMALLGSGAPGDSGAGLSDLKGPATTIHGILTGGEDDRYEDKGGNLTHIAWKNSYEGYGLGFTPQLVGILNNRCAQYTPTPGAATLGIAAAGVFAWRRRRV